ncbi:MAG: SDR family NAD(P)-dependent oxidoreductase [Burkholderiales bacterium]|nr:SDR family NAD(P)-dependent oxidoreductase [Burkholderiales bacterium]
MDLGLNGRVALVTGASRGLGRATAQTLAAEGAFVVAVARPSVELADLAAAHAGRCVTVEGDLLDPALPRRAVAAALSHFGRLDIAVVNTPGPRPVLPLDAGEEDFAAAFESTFYPAVRLIHAVREPMAERAWGRIVVVSSTSVKAPKPFLCLSAASRTALWAWAKSAAPALYERGVTINAVFAGPHDTARSRELGVAGRVVGRPDDFGRFVASMCGDSSRFITGAGWLLDGGELTGL